MTCWPHCCQQAMGALFRYSRYQDAGILDIVGGVHDTSSCSAFHNYCIAATSMAAGACGARTDQEECDRDTAETRTTTIVLLRSKKSCMQKLSVANLGRKSSRRSGLSLALAPTAKRCGPSTGAIVLVGTSELHAHCRRGARDHPALPSSAGSCHVGVARARPCASRPALVVSSERMGMRRSRRAARPWPHARATAGTAATARRGADARDLRAPTMMAPTL
jgi:hypothetical protein